MSLEEGIKALAKGKKILIYDSSDREGETDIIIPAKKINHNDISFLRNKGGGLICVTLPYEVTESIGLPYISDILENQGFSEANIPYGEKSSFSLWVNHVETFTGITDKDRAKTAQELANVHKKIIEGKSISFKEEFRSPGHVPILKGAKNLLKNRSGHTELSMAIAEMSEILPTLVICEMLDDNSGDALSKEDAQKFAKEKDIPFVEGKEIIKNY